MGIESTYDEVIETSLGRNMGVTSMRGSETDSNGMRAEASVRSSRSHARISKPSTTLIGREELMGSLKQFLNRQDVRLATLTGPGGIGKSTIASAVAHDFDGDAAFISLAELNDPELIPATILRGLGLDALPGRSAVEAIGNSLSGRTFLLVLDNYEHLLDGAFLPGALLAASPMLKILVTSRIRLGVDGEHVVAVEPLEIPNFDDTVALDSLAEVGSVRLFVERAGASQAGFVLSDANVGAVASVCQRLEGVPLAIELAAARIVVLSPMEMVAHLSERFDVLAAGPRNAPARHRSLRDTIAWSYDLLPTGTQWLFRQLSVFVGGFNFEAAESVSDQPGGRPTDLLGDISLLVDHCLVIGGARRS